MSIYGTTWDTSADDHEQDCEQDCARWVECGCPDSRGAHGRWMGGNDGRHWRYDGNLPCSCLCGPIIYQGSHVLPSDDGPEDEDQPWPYLRVTMRAEDAAEPQDVVLDGPLIESLTDYLVAFRERRHGQAPSGDVYPLAVE